MVTFADILDWDTSDTFYKDIDIGLCGLEIIFDGTLGRSWWLPVTSVDNMPQQVYDPKQNKIIGPNCNRYQNKYHGCPGENYIFIDTSNTTLYEVSERESSDEDCGSCIFIEARVGYMVHLYIHEDNKRAEFLDIPVKYHMIDYCYRSWGEGGTNGYSREFPYFQTFPIPEEEDISPLMEGLKNMHWDYKFSFTHSFQNIMDVPKPLRNFFLRKNKKVWWAANKIAAAWSHTYWSPYTLIGRKRLEKNIKELGIES